MTDNSASGQRTAISVVNNGATSSTGFQNKISPQGYSNFPYFLSLIKPAILAGALIKKKIQFSSYIRKIRMEQLQNHI
jgi:hypothetical protein